MEIYDVVGFRKVDFKDKSGNVIKGYSLMLARPFDKDSKDAAGTEVRKEFISSDYFLFCYVLFYLYSLSFSDLAAVR